MNQCNPLLILGVLLVALSGCQTGDQVNAPQETQFQIPALGTPVPIGAGMSPASLPNNGSGALFINNASLQVRVAVSNTIVTIDPKEGFLFVLPAGSYQFYIYGVEPATQIDTEKIEPGKVRYIYLLPPVQ